MSYYRSNRPATGSYAERAWLPSSSLKQTPGQDFGSSNPTQSILGSQYQQFPTRSFYGQRATASSTSFVDSSQAFGTSVRHRAEPAFGNSYLQSSLEPSQSYKTQPVSGSSRQPPVNRNVEHLRQTRDRPQGQRRHDVGVASSAAASTLISNAIRQASRKLGLVEDSESSESYRSHVFPTAPLPKNPTGDDWEVSKSLAAKLQLQNEPPASDGTTSSDSFKASVRKGSVEHQKTSSLSTGPRADARTLLFRAMNDISYTQRRLDDSLNAKSELKLNDCTPSISAGSSAASLSLFEPDPWIERYVPKEARNAWNSALVILDDAKDRYRAYRGRGGGFTQLDGGATQRKEELAFLDAAWVQISELQKISDSTTLNGYGEGYYPRFPQALDYLGTLSRQIQQDDQGESTSQASGLAEPEVQIGDTLLDYARADSPRGPEQHTPSSTASASPRLGEAGRLGSSQLHTIYNRLQELQDEMFIGLPSHMPRDIAFAHATGSKRQASFSAFFQSLKKDLKHHLDVSMEDFRLFEGFYRRLASRTNRLVETQAHVVRKLSLRKFQNEHEALRELHSDLLRLDNWLIATQDLFEQWWPDVDWESLKLNPAEAAQDEDSAAAMFLGMAPGKVEVGMKEAPSARSMSPATEESAGGPTMQTNSELLEKQDSSSGSLTVKWPHPPKDAKWTTDTLPHLVETNTQLQLKLAKINVDLLPYSDPQRNEFLDELDKGLLEAWKAEYAWQNERRHLPLPMYYDGHLIENVIAGVKDSMNEMYQVLRRDAREVEGDHFDHGNTDRGRPNFFDVMAKEAEHEHESGLPEITRQQNLDSRLYSLTDWFPANKAAEAEADDEFLPSSDEEEILHAPICVKCGLRVYHEPGYTPSGRWCQCLTDALANNR
jgi:hypothetical protein